MVDAVVRERGQHVTYESKHWQRLFNIIPTLFDTLFVALSGMACSRPAATDVTGVESAAQPLQRGVDESARGWGW